MLCMKKTKTFMYIVVFGVLVVATFFPGVVFANSSSIESCSPVGYTVAFINGILNTHEDAKANALALQLVLGNSYKLEPVRVELVYNPEHIGGVGDLAESVSQIFFSPISELDFHSILQQLSDKVTTRKLTIVGHSQGTLYANRVYDYLTSNGLPTRSLNVYSVATPAPVIAGQGRYINADGDAVIIAARLLAEKLHTPLPLPSNAHLYGIKTSVTELENTHAFLSYLSGAREKIIADIHEGFDALQAPSVFSEPGRCIAQLPTTLADHMQHIVFSVVDPLAMGVKTAASATYTTVAAAVDGAVRLATTGWNLLGSAATLFTGTVAHANNDAVADRNQEKSFVIVKKLYGSSIDEETYRELNPQKQTAVAVATATSIPRKDVAIIPTNIPLVVATSVPGSPIAVATSTPAPGAPNPFQYYFGGGGGGGNDPLPQPAQTEAVEISEPTAASSDATTTVVVQSVDEATSTTSTTSNATTTTSIAEASSTQPLVLDEVTSTTATTSTPVAITTLPHVPFLSDTFDADGALGKWQAYGVGAKSFYAPNNPGTECKAGSCAVASPSNRYLDYVPRMYLEQPEVAALDGTFTVYMRVELGQINSPHPQISVCTKESNCTGVAINFVDFASDNSWHIYLVSWRQGAQYVEACLLADKVDVIDCVWKETSVPAGATFDGVVLGSITGFRADYGANLWFDELIGR